ncbi:MAG: YggS family pyridoxal phosphate-dependent enzyme [Rhodobacteraceae bacterium]|nr:YggS family pyridoxal phosphate-dependent enzyme [Paracoccaceae bacterium]
MQTLIDVRRKLAHAAQAAGRQADNIELIAVSKQQPIERVEAVLAAGQRIFGENRVQEAAGKWPALRARYGDVALHLIGPLQTNKARQAVEMASHIHTLDRPKLATTLARLAQERGACPHLFIQVNTGEEPQKAGVAPAEAEAFAAQCRKLDLPVIGLMCIPPAGQDPVPHFAQLRKLAEGCGLAGLSMGMSGDYELAVAEGATHVRVGSAIFGAR